MAEVECGPGGSADGSCASPPARWEQLKSVLLADGWSAPTAVHDAGEVVVGASVFGEGHHGEGLVLGWSKSRLGPSSHRILFGDGQTKAV